MLASVDWVAAGCQLYSIACFAGSSADGWFTIPAETNSLFLWREQWDALDGYDPAFSLPGGGCPTATPGCARAHCPARR